VTLGDEGGGLQEEVDQRSRRSSPRGAGTPHSPEHDRGLDASEWLEDGWSPPGEG
jgi:hypothetical protein